MNLAENILGKMNGENYAVMAGLIMQLLKTAEREKDETQNQHPGRDGPQRLQMVL